ncbi:MAG: hypothetical protein ACI9OJ_005919 [Myxococcota bacterium]|jgi:hypothetical protein
MTQPISRSRRASCPVTLITVAVLLAASGCQDGSAVGETSPPNPNSDQSMTLVLEVETWDTHHPVPILTTPFNSPPETILSATHSVDVAMGADYPSTITLVFDNAYGHCIDSYDDDGVTFTIDSMVSGLASESLDATASGADRLSISPTETGSFTIDLTGSVVLDAECAAKQKLPVNRRFEIALTVRVFRPVTTQIFLPEVCALSATPQLESPAVFATFMSDLWSVEVFDASDVTRFVSTFGLTAVKGSGLALEGGSYTVPEPNGGTLTRSMELIVAEQWAGENAYCTPPKAENYSVESLTPDVCPASDGPPHGDVQIPVFQTSAELAADGRCTLDVTGPSSTEPSLFDMTFAGTERLGPVPTW